MSVAPAGRFDRNSTALDVVEHVDLSDRLAIVTGASSGIGTETARAFVSAGADVVLAVRDTAAGERVAQEIGPTTRGCILVEHLDLRDLESVTTFAGRIDRPVDILVANAGVSNTPDSHLPSGLEVRFATNHLGHFLLTSLLRDRLMTAGGRVVVVSSAAHKGNPVSLDDLQWRARPHHWGPAYGESKSANILFAHELTRRWQREGVVAFSVLPGTALTGLQRFHGDELIRAIGFVDAEGRPHPMLKTVPQAAATSVWAATAHELDDKGGLVLEDNEVAVPAGPDTHLWTGFDENVMDPATAQALWDHSLELVGQYHGR